MKRFITLFVLLGSCVTAFGQWGGTRALTDTSRLETQFHVFKLEEGQRLDGPHITADSVIATSFYNSGSPYMKHYISAAEEMMITPDSLSVGPENFAFDRAPATLGTDNGSWMFTWKYGCANNWVGKVSPYFRPGGGGYYTGPHALIMAHCATKSTSPAGQTYVLFIMSTGQGGTPATTSIATASVGSYTPLCDSGDFAFASDGTGSYIQFSESNGGNATSVSFTGWVISGSGGM